MKYLKLYETFLSQGYKDELDTELNRYANSVEQFDKEYARHHQAIYNIESKWQDENAKIRQKALNIIDVCMEPLTDKYELYQSEDEEPNTHNNYQKIYVTDKDIIVTSDLMSDLIKTNKRLKAELDKDL